MFPKNMLQDANKNGDEKTQEEEEVNVDNGSGEEGKEGGDDSSDNSTEVSVDEEEGGLNGGISEEKKEEEEEEAETISTINPITNSINSNFVKPHVDQNTIVGDGSDPVARNYAQEIQAFSTDLVDDCIGCFELTGVKWVWQSIICWPALGGREWSKIQSEPVRKCVRILVWTAAAGVVVAGAVGGIKYLEDGNEKSVTNIYGSDDTNDDNNNVDTFAPTQAQTITPTLIPTINSPSLSPTPHPTVGPTLSPTPDQSNSPTFSPTLDQSNSPTFDPTFSSTTNSPTPFPSFSPTTNSPTTNPTTSPSITPTLSPTTSPSITPTLSPTTSPSITPTLSPTSSPSNNPTRSPTTTSPTTNPTTSPSVTPTRSPTTNSPTTNPTTSPSITPTLSPTSSPSNNPTQSPTTNSPTLSPTFSSTTNSPTSSPSNNPTLSPTFVPTSQPTLQPTVAPTMTPTSSSFSGEYVPPTDGMTCSAQTICTGLLAKGVTVSGPTSGICTVSVTAQANQNFDVFGDGISGTLEALNTAIEDTWELTVYPVPIDGQVPLTLTLKDENGDTVLVLDFTPDLISSALLSVRDYIKTDPLFKEYLTKQETRNAQWSHMRQEGGAIPKEQADFIRDYIKQQLENNSELESSQDYMDYCYLRGVSPQWSQSANDLDRFMMLKQYQHFRPGVCEFVDTKYDDKEDLNVLLADPYVQVYAKQHGISLKDMGPCTISRLSQFERACTYYRSKHNDDMAPDTTTQEVTTAIDQAIHQEVAEASTPGGVFSTHEYNQYVRFQKWPPTHDAYDLYLRLENFQGYQRHVKRIEVSMNEDLYGSKQGELHVAGLNTKFCDFINNKLSVAEFNEMEPEQRDQLQSEFIAEQIVALNEEIGIDVEISAEKMADLSDYARSIGVDMSTASPSVQLYAKINYKAFLNLHENHEVVASSEFLDHAATYNRIPTNDIQMNKVLTEYEGGQLWKLASKAYSAVSSTASSLLFGGKQQPSRLTCPSKEDFSNNLRGNIETLPMMRRLMGGR